MSRDATRMVFDRETREIEHGPIVRPETDGKVDDLMRMVADQESRRERRLGAVADYFSGERTEEALKATIAKMQSA